MHPYTNRLIHETSPYLLQHAHNPVDWFPWGDEAFEKAMQEDKPVLVGIGYAACHWCHVMERESFEDPQVAALMNERFVNIKVDREERPDVDHIYMDAVQAISGSGGWPLNVFLTPQRKPFYGGTYFPPQKAFNRASWKDILVFVSDAYHNRRVEVDRQAGDLTNHIAVSNVFGAPATDTDFSAADVDEAFGNIMKTADREWGGFGRAPKFPQSFTIDFLLQYASIKNNDEALGQALLSIDKMIEGGIYDQVGGGFSRYSTDSEWLAPHFEKMLYDNALLVSTLASAYQLTGKGHYKTVLVQTLDFVEREMMHPHGGFYSALDADSEGEEGKFYVWSHEEVSQILGTTAPVFSSFYDISAKGNWEGKNILRIKKTAEDFAVENNLAMEALETVLQQGREALFKERSKRVRPGLDDKVILAWNALMNLGYSKAYAATGEVRFRQVAERNMQFVLSAFRNGDGLNHTWKNGASRHPAFLDDYSYLIAALTELAQVTGNFDYLREARRLTAVVLESFSDEDLTFFYFTHKDQQDVPVRKKEIYDGAVPSGNALMALNLYRQAIIFDEVDWKVRAQRMVRSLKDVIIKYPTSFGLWLSLYFEILQGTKEIVVLGGEWEIYLRKLLGIYIPHKVVQAAEKPHASYPLLQDKPESVETRIYLCENYACRRPVKTIADFVSLLQRK